MAMPRPRLRASRANQTTNQQQQQQQQLPHGSAPSAALPRLPMGDLPPRLGGGVANVQLRRLQEHQRHLEEMERLRRERQERVRKDDRMEEQKREERSEEEEDDDDDDDDDDEQQASRRDQLALQLQHGQNEHQQQAHLHPQQSNGGPGPLHQNQNQLEMDHKQQSNGGSGPLHHNQQGMDHIRHLQQYNGGAGNQDQSQQHLQSNGGSERRLELRLDHEHQIRQWQQELEDHSECQSQRQQQPPPPPPVALLSPSATSALGTIYEALEAEMEEENEGEGGGGEEKRVVEEEEERCVKSKDGGGDGCHDRKESGCSSASLPTPQEQGDYTTQSSLLSDMDSHTPSSPEQDDDDVCSRHQHLLGQNLLGQNGTAVHQTYAHRPEEELISPELDWGSKAGLVQQLISQTLLFVKAGSEGRVRGVPGEGLGQGANHGTLSPLESSHWPQLLLSPLTNPSTTATVTAVSSYAPQVTHGNTQPQGEWTVVEVETHH